MRTEFDRRTQLANISMIAGLGCFGAAGVVWSIKYALSDKSRKEQLEKEAQLLPWNAVQRVQDIDNTTVFRQLQAFGKGPAFGGPSTYFPFTTKINPEATRAFRKEISDLIPLSDTIEFHADHENNIPSRKIDPERKVYIFAASFDKRIAQSAFHKTLFKDLPTSDSKRKEFAQKVEQEILLWMLEEVYSVAEELGKPKPSKEEFAQKAQKLSSPIHVEADPVFNYFQYYVMLE